MRLAPFAATAVVCSLFASISAGQQVQAGEQPANPTQEIAKEQPEGPADDGRAVVAAAPEDERPRLKSLLMRWGCRW